MAGMPGILCRPAFQALPGLITLVLDHLGRGHRRGGVQVHHALSFLGAGHIIILSFGLQENVRTLLSADAIHIKPGTMQARMIVAMVPLRRLRHSPLPAEPRTLTTGRTHDPLRFS